MHGISVHSALAIKRQRRRRAEAERRRHNTARRPSTTSTLAHYLERKDASSHRANKVGDIHNLTFLLTSDPKANE